MTTTSSSPRVCSSSVTCMPSVGFTVCGLNPTYDTVTRFPGVSSRVKSPLMSVIVPPVPPFSLMVAPTMGSPFASLTFPFIRRFCPLSGWPDCAFFACAKLIWLPCALYANPVAAHISSKICSAGRPSRFTLTLLGIIFCTSAL